MGKKKRQFVEIGIRDHPPLTIPRDSRLEVLDGFGNKSTQKVSEIRPNSGLQLYVNQSLLKGQNKKVPRGEVLQTIYNHDPEYKNFADILYPSFNPNGQSTSLFTQLLLEAAKKHQPTVFPDSLENIVNDLNNINSSQRQAVITMIQEKDESIPESTVINWLRYENLGPNDNSTKASVALPLDKDRLEEIATLSEDLQTFFKDYNLIKRAQNELKRVHKSKIVQRYIGSERFSKTTPDQSLNQRKDIQPIHYVIDLEYLDNMLKGRFPIQDSDEFAYVSINNIKIFDSHNKDILKRAKETKLKIRNAPQEFKEISIEEAYSKYQQLVEIATIRSTVFATSIWAKRTKAKSMKELEYEKYAIFCALNHLLDNQFKDINNFRNTYGCIKTLKKIDKNTEERLYKELVEQMQDFAFDSDHCKTQTQNITGRRIGQESKEPFYQVLRNARIYASHIPSTFFHALNMICDENTLKNVKNKIRKLEDTNGRLFTLNKNNKYKSLTTIQKAFKFEHVPKDIIFEGNIFRAFDHVYNIIREESPYLKPQVLVETISSPYSLQRVREQEMKPKQVLKIVQENEK